jgi:hypothetical protein
MKKLSAASQTLVLALLIGVTGCVAAIGNRDAQRGGTLGQQLIDLQKARDNGAMTESEYQTQKARLLDNTRKP